MIEKARKLGRALALREMDIECGRIPHVFHNVPYSKILSWLLVESSVFVRPARPWALPTHLQIEPTNTCNLRCKLCPVTEGMGRRSGFMDVGLFEKLLDEVGHRLFLIVLWDWGEPFLHPEIARMISHAKSKGVKVVSSTNGHPFARPGVAEAVVRSGLDTIYVAIDGIHQETYERYRGRGKLETALEGLRALVAAKRLLHSEGPLINLRFIAMKHNEHEAPELREFARSFGVDALTIKTLNPLAADDAGLDTDHAFIPANPKYQRFCYDRKTGRRKRVRTVRCKPLWNSAAIHWDGNVCICTYDARDEYVMGSLRESSFHEIWSGERYREIRRKFSRDYRSIPLCAQCSYGFQGGTECIAELEFFPE